MDAPVPVSFYRGMRLNLLLLCAIPAMTLAACERPEGAEPAAAPEPAGPIDQSEAEPVAEPTSECVNDSGGYALEHPASWHVYTGDLLGPCSLFHPAPFEVPAYSEVPMEIDLGGSTLIAVTYDAGDMRFERKRRVLDAMMSTLEFVRQD